MYVTANQVKYNIAQILGPYWNQKKYSGFSDSKYYLVHTYQIQEYLNSNPIQGAPSLGEGFDCDDYTYVLKGNLSLANRDEFGLEASLCVGIAWGQFQWVQEFHATNWFLAPSGIFQWIEPQNNTIYPLDSCIPGSLKLVLL